MGLIATRYLLKMIAPYKEAPAAKIPIVCRTRITLKTVVAASDLDASSSKDTLATSSSKDTLEVLLPVKDPAI